MGYIKGGKYHKGIAPREVQLESSTYKQADHEQQRIDHRHDMIQPHDPQTGEFRQEFIEEYLLKDQELADQYNFHPEEDYER